MVYVIEGARNSGKTFLSTEISKSLNIPRFQFVFADAFKLLSLSSNSMSAHALAMGKEMMLMQLARDLNMDFPDIIHDRGILSVLAWGICEGRISKAEALKELAYLETNNFFKAVKIIYIEGENPDKGPRNKDQWDFADGSDSERLSYEWLINETDLYKRVTVFRNTFDGSSVEAFKKLFIQVY